MTLNVYRSIENMLQQRDFSFVGAALMEWNWERYKWSAMHKYSVNTLHDIKSMSRPGMDKPAERLSWEWKNWFRVRMGAIFTFKQQIAGKPKWVLRELNDVRLCNFVARLRTVASRQFSALASKGWAWRTWCIWGAASGLISWGSTKCVSRIKMIVNMRSQSIWL